MSDKDEGYVLKLYFDDYDRKPWVEIEYPDSVDDARDIIARYRADERHFKHATLYKTITIDLDIEG